MGLLQVGDKAPDVTFNTTGGVTFPLASFAGKKNVVVAFYARAFTGG